jgi:tetratricopeptide (TPR) repeat protein
MLRVELMLTFVRTQMYKKRIARWGLYKNYSASEMVQIARIVQSYDAQGHDVPPLIIRGRPALLHRVRRFFGRGKRTMRPCRDSAISVYLPATPGTEVTSTSPLPSSNCEAKTPSPTVGWKIEESGKTPPPSLERPFCMRSGISRVELILRETQRYLSKHLAEEWYLIPPESDSIQPQAITTVPYYRTGQNPDEIITNTDWPKASVEYDTRRHMYACMLREMFCSGLELLEQAEPRRAWQLLHEASDMVRQVLSEPYGDLLRVLLLLFRDESFDNFLKIKQHVLSFFANTSKILHGRDHPLSTILLHMQDADILLQSCSPVLELMADMLQSYASSSAATWRVRLGLCDLLRRQRSYEAAESIALKLLKDYEDFGDPVQKHTRVTLRRLGNIYSDWGDEGRAESTYHATLEKGRFDLGEDFPDDCGIFAFRSLACLYEKQGDYLRSESNWRAALDGALNEWGADSEVTILCLLKLEDVLRKQGKELSGCEQRLKAILSDHV